MIITVSPEIFAELGLSAGAIVTLRVEHERLFLKPVRPRYMLEELLADYDSTTPSTEDEREWLDARPVGKGDHLTSSVSAMTLSSASDEAVCPENLLFFLVGDVLTKIYN